MRWLWSTVFGILGVAAMLAACTAGDGSSDLNDGKGAGASGAGTSSSGDGGFNATGGGQGTGGLEVCQAIGQEALPEKKDADIIFVIDTSASMAQESAFVRQQMTAFSQQIINSGVDVRVIMLAERPIFPGCQICPGVCIDAPLGSGACPADDNPPIYHHPLSDVGSSDSLSVIVDLYPAYAGVLRDNTNKYIVIVTDDNARTPYIADAAEFVNTFTALEPAKLAGFTVHGIYCFNDSGPCASKGQVYEDLVNLTGGIHGDLELQNFQPVFDAVASEVIVQSGLPCDYPIPAPPEGEVLDPSLVNVVYTDGNGNPNDLYNVDNAAACQQVAGGWYYDDNANPTSIHLCPATCDIVSVDGSGKLDILFGCATQVGPPA